MSRPRSSRGQLRAGGAIYSPGPSAAGAKLCVARRKRPAAGAGGRSLVFLLNLLALQLLASGLCNGAQKQQQQQQPQPTSYTKSPAAATSGRPLERPSLSLVSSNRSAQSFALARPMPEGAGDWFMMGGGDLAPEEGRRQASFAAADEPSLASSRRSNVTRRMAEVKHRKSGGGGGGKNSSRSIFDDEQAGGPAASASEPAGESNEIYDDVEENSSAMAGTQKEPECAAHGRYYCTFKEDYPLKLVTEVTKYYKWPLEKLFRDLHAQIMPKLAPDSTGNLVCDSVTRVVRPGWARNTNERWLVVINTDNYHQYVTEVVCQYGTNSRCNFIPPCYYSSCQQRYNTQKLLVIDPTNPYRGPFLSEFLFPSCCVCYVPASSDTFQDKYRSSPATIYQRTMQQEAASNLNPPQFRPPGLSLLEEAFSSSNVAASGLASLSGLNGGGGGGGGSGGGSSLAAGANANGALNQQQQQQLNGAKQAAGSQPAGPGEIRRAGEQYRRALEQQQQQQQLEEGAGGRQARQLEPPGAPAADYGAELASFPRLGLADSLVSQKAAPRE